MMCLSPPRHTLQEAREKAGSAGEDAIEAEPSSSINQAETPAPSGTVSAPSQKQVSLHMNE